MNPTDNGKAFEFACVMAMSNALTSLKSGIDPIICQNSSLVVANTCYDALVQSDRVHADSLLRAGNKLCNVLLQTEPKLSHLEKTHKPLIMLTIQPDAAGKAGDVRDIIAVKEVIDNKKAWEIGISCKHNHDAVKHPRISKTIDFGSMWLGEPLQRDDYAQLSQIFDLVDSEKANGNATWSHVVDKDAKFYMPILNLILNKIYSNPYKDKLAKHLLHYLIGNQDFYKVIYQDDRKTIHVQGFNFGGTLNQSADDRKPTLTVNKLHFPSRIIQSGFKPDSTNTIEIFFDKGWQISLRIHNASTLLEKSLKMDVRLEGTPDNLFNFSENI